MKTFKVQEFAESLKNSSGFRNSSSILCIQKTASFSDCEIDIDLVVFSSFDELIENIESIHICKADAWIGYEKTANNNDEPINSESLGTCLVQSTFGRHGYYWMLSEISGVTFDQAKKIESL